MSVVAHALRPAHSGTTDGVVGTEDSDTDGWTGIKSGEGMCHVTTLDPESKDPPVFRTHPRS